MISELTLTNADATLSASASGGLGDTNDDGFADFSITAHEADGYSDYTVFLNNGNGGFIQGSGYVVYGSTIESGVDTQGDSILVYKQYSPPIPSEPYAVSVTHPDGTGTYYESSTIPQFTFPPAVASRDQAPDNVTLDDSSNTITVAPSASLAGYETTTYSLPAGATIPGMQTIYPTFNGGIYSGGKFTIILHLQAPGLSDFFFYSGTLNQISDEVPCYASGTRILTDRGEVPVEALAVGDRVMALHSQGFEPVTWIGRRSVRPEAHARPETVRPVRIRRSALAEGRPTRDLVVSPGHALFLDGVLVHAETLVNGVTIVQERVAEVTYWHVELARHDVLIAEGVAAESYLEDGNRASFEAGRGVVALRAAVDGARTWDGCAPLLRSGPAVAAIRARLLARTEALGCRLGRDAALQLVLGSGVPVQPEWVSEHACRFTLPKGARGARLVSATWVPAHVDGTCEDRRVLGVCVRRLRVDGREIALASLRALGGWHEGEVDTGDAWCWSDGAGVLPEDAGMVEVWLGGGAQYWEVVEEVGERVVA